MKPHELHRASARTRLGIRIVTVSSSRHVKSKGGGRVVDEAGDLAASILDSQGHKCVGRELISDDRGMLDAALREGLADRQSDVIIFIGGTGLSPKDITIETVSPSFTKEMAGFGELLRSMSFRRIGAAAALTRATAGVIGDRLVLCLPGSPDAVKTALDVFGPELPHAVYIARGD